MTIRRRLPLVMVVVALLSGPFAATEALAIPVLQLDILNGTYDSSAKTIIAPGASFTLFALLTPPDTKPATHAAYLADTYYISAALTPRVTPPGASLGTFGINGPIDSSQPSAGCVANTPCNVRVTEDMIYGNPPFETYTGAHDHDKGDLGNHENLFQTYYIEFAFRFTAANRSVAYDSKSTPGKGPTPSSTGNAYYQAFQIDTSYLHSGYAIHFDLYSIKLKSGGDIDINTYAPFDRDAQSLYGSGLTPPGNDPGGGGDDLPPLPVSEPATALLLGTALAALRLGRRKPTSRSADGSTPR